MRPSATPVALLALAALAGCEAGAPAFREVSAREARELALRAGTHVVQVGGAPGSPSLPLAVGEGVKRVDGSWEWPPEVAAGPVLIVSVEPEQAYRLAARMARAGIQGVAVVSGGVAAWNRERTLARRDGAASRESEGDGSWPKSPM